MRLLRLLDGNELGASGSALLMLGVSALIVTAQLSLVNKASAYSGSTKFLILAVVVFAALLAAGYLLRARGSARLMALIEKALLERRRRLFDLIRDSDLRTFEQLEGVDTGFSRDIEQLGALTPVLIDWLVYAMMLVGFGVALLVVSPLGAAVWAGTLGMLGWVLLAQRHTMQQALARVDQAWPRRRRLVEQLTRGFAQLKMDAAAAAALRHEAYAAGRELDDAQLNRLAFDNYQAPLASLAIFHLGLVALLFFDPISGVLEPSARLEIVTTFMLSYRAVTYLVEQVGAFVTADQALCRLDALEATLAGSASDSKQPTPDHVLTAFTDIELQQVVFSYRQQNRPTFTVGPISLSLKRGEVVFITGSNGSGKTTLMKLLTGLYTPDEGQIKLDGKRLPTEALDAYRTLFTSVFMDHHLFAPPYGLDVKSPERVHDLLRQFNLESVVHFQNGRFAPLDLSTGQRQRLAMVVALLEDRPIYVLDEWAAHQDPYLRRYFYETLLPQMRAAGKTVVAISHDARFFGLADRRFHLVGGRLQAA